MVTPAPKPDPALVIPEFREWIAALPCVFCIALDRTQKSRTEVCHYKTRRNAGDRMNLFPACGECHRAQHAKGIRSFARACGVNLYNVVRNLWYVYLDSSGACDVCGQNCGEGHALAF